MFLLIYCYLSKFANARHGKKTSFGCQCGNANVGAGDEIRRKRQTTNYALDVISAKRDTSYTWGNDNNTLEKLQIAEAKLLSDEYLRIVNGYEPDRRPWIILLQISR